MKPFLDVIVREPLRNLLLKGLRLTEKSEKKVVSRGQDTLINRDIHIPPVLVAICSSLFLMAILVMQFGWFWRSLISITVFVILSLTLFIFYLKHDLPNLIEDDEAMMLLGTLVILFVLIIGGIKRWPLSSFMTPLPAASILAALLLHPRLSIMLTMVLSMFFALSHDFSSTCFFMGFFGGLAGTAAALSVRSYRDFIRVSVIVSVAQIFTLIIVSSLGQVQVTPFLWRTLWCLGNAFISSVLALGLLPFLESFFSRLTPMKLIELSDFNQPLLKRLMLEAPGTYHHSLIMATLAESAAQRIGANPLLCRVGSYYHDIGKLIKPEYFIENQGGLKSNPHNEIAPALSRLVVISHVKEGIAMAKSAKLPNEIINFIPMHHGTSRIEYFYQQALEDAQEELFRHGENEKTAKENVEEEHFRYPGPRPLSKEAAILMLADSVEATARTIDEPSHDRFQDLVKNIFNKKLEDGQLSNSPLTLGDLTLIRDSFVITLTSIHHARIEYPKESNE